MNWNREFWERACNASFARSLSEIKETNFVAGGVAVCFFPPCSPPLSHSVSDFDACFSGCYQRGVLFARLQAAALENKRQGGRW